MNRISSTIFWLLVASDASSAWMMPTTTMLRSDRRSSLQSQAYDSSDWSTADDWESLSDANSMADSNAIFNQDIAHNAAQSILPDNHDEEMEPLSEEEVWLNDVIEDILNTPLSSTPLYDAPTFTTARTKKKTPQQQQQELEQRMEDEIAMLIRCNESPEDMLIQVGRAVPELTSEQKHDVAQLLVWQEDAAEEDDKASQGYWEASPFFSQAIAKIFQTHATPNPKETENIGSIMDAKAVAKWMTQSIGEELGTYTERAKKGTEMTSARQKKNFKIAPHDSRVRKMLTQYSTYGTGHLTMENLERCYMEALTRSNGKEIPATGGSLELFQLQNAENIRQVWRDLTNHNIVSPIEQQWKQERLRLQEKFGSLQQQTHKLLEGDFVDECEILDFSAYQAPPTAKEVEEGHDEKNHKYIKKSSHEQVKLAEDGKTPLYMDEGQFVFIDEESCIGCMQCANAAPSNFLMLENGRARTFHQRSGADVRQGVAACPVNCMHYVSYDELKELETVRDKGDGRDDHRHMGHRRGHTPLYVAGIDSDNNHRSSWYHHIKNKCCTSGRCPQRGCFDCPSYKLSGGNPYFQKKAKEGQHIRASHFIEKGDVDLWRKTADL